MGLGSSLKDRPVHTDGPPQLASVETLKPAHGPEIEGQVSQTLGHDVKGQMFQRQDAENDGRCLRVRD
jgi:hypothetical protein